MSTELTPITEAPDTAELAERLKKVQEMMAKENLDVYVSYDPVNVFYLTNFFNYVHERPFILIIPKQGPPMFLVPQLEVPHVKTRANCDLKIVHYFEYPAPKGENWYDAYHTLVSETARVGVESAMTLEIFDQTPGKKVKTDIIDTVRLIKSGFEIGRYFHACQVLNMGHEKLLEICRPGKMMFEINAVVSQTMMARILTEIKKFNPLNTKVYGVVSPPAISDDPHNFTNLSQPMEKGGPHVSVVAGQIDGCGVELERTFFLGSVPQAAIKPFQVMMEARELAYERLKPGNNMGDIDTAVKKHFDNAGYLENLLHRTGHGIGITGHEGPFLAEGYDKVLEPGMMISVEPGIYIPGLGGFRHSDTVLITDHGYVKLTQAPDNLEALTIPL